MSLPHRIMRHHPAHAVCVVFFVPLPLYHTLRVRLTRIQQVLSLRIQSALYKPSRSPLVLLPQPRRIHLQTPLQEDDRIYEEDLESVPMSTNPRKRKLEKDTPKFYGVRAGKKPGVYTSWGDCQENTTGFKGASCKVPLSI